MIKCIIFVSLIFVPLVLSGCVTPEAETFRGPDGAAIAQVRCNQKTTQCFQKATETCDGSYSVLDSYSNAGGLVADVMPGPVTWYTMSISCGPSDGRMPSFPFRGQNYSAPPVVFTQPAAPQPMRITNTNCSGMGDYMNCTSTSY